MIAEQQDWKLRWTTWLRNTEKSSEIWVGTMWALKRFTEDIEVGDG